MEAVGSKEVIYEFGKFSLDPGERLLLADGQPVHLPSKEFETLLLLVENNGRALSKDEMISVVWQDSFVEEGNLAKQISRLRKILNTGGGEFIETIPKHGYRFSANLRVRTARHEEPIIVERQIVNRVTISQEPDPKNMPEVGPPRLPPADKTTNLRWLVLAGLAIAAFGVAVYLWTSVNPERTNATAVRSIAVLPFASVGQDEVDEQLRMGLTDSLTTKLSSLERIVVRPTNAVRPFDGQDAVEAGRSLRVDAILAGNVQRSADKVRVTVQLVNVGSGSILWGGSFDEISTDIFRVQDAIAAQAARSLALTLTGEELERIAKRHTTNADAHYAYVRGRIAWNKRTANDLRQSVSYFEEAIRNDPNYALAYAGLADSYSLMADYRAAPTLQSYDNARSAAVRALELDPDLAEAHTALAYASMYGTWDFKAAEREYERAVEINQNYATAHQWYSEFLASQGRTEEALAEIRRAKEIDPLSPVINAGEVWVLYYARRYDEAIDLGRKLADTNPDFAEVHEYLKRCYDQKGLYREAIAARQMRRKLVGLDHSETPALRTAAAATDRMTYWRARLEQELTEMRSEDPSTFDMAEIFSQLGEKDNAFEWLERSAKDRTYTMVYLKVAPNLDPIRSDARFAPLLQLVGL